MGYEKVHGGFDFGDQNEADKSILDFAIAFDLVVTNTFYIKNITFKGGANRSQID